jgi:hypothetical protein
VPVSYSISRLSLRISNDNDWQGRRSRVRAARETQIAREARSNPVRIEMNIETDIDKARVPAEGKQDETRSFRA